MENRTISEGGRWYEGGDGRMKRDTNKRYKKRMILGSTLVLVLVLSSCQAKEHNKEASADHTAIQAVRHEAASARHESTAYQQESSNSPAQSDEFIVEAVGNLGADYRLLADQYYKAGDIRYTLSFSDGGVEPLPVNQLECFFSLPEQPSSGSAQRYESARFLTEQGKTSYEITPQGYIGNTDTLTGDTVYTISVGRDSASALFVTVKGDGELEGDYYPLLKNCTYPSIFTRYLAKADLCLWSIKSLGLLRNEVYAAYGREFESEDLNKYFSQFDWYRGRVRAEDFSDSIMSDMEKKNVELIRQMEQESKRRRLDGTKPLSLEDLPAAPYLPYLGLYDETGIDADLSKAKDMGAYYIVPGEILHPVSITPEQLREVKGGGQAKVVLDERTGQIGIMTRDSKEEDSSPSLYKLYEDGQVSDDPEQGTEIYLFKDYEHGTYMLEQDSDDTLMKTVYKGDIYILKGAVSGHSEGLEKASKNQMDMFQNIHNGDELFGNSLFYNPKGYFTAVYALSD